MSKEKSKFTIYAEYIPVLLIYKFIHALPLKYGYAVAKTIIKLMPIVDKRHYNRALEHLIHAKVAKDSHEAEGYAKKVFSEFSKLFVEIVRADVEYKREKVNFVGEQKNLDMIVGENSKQFIIVTAHYGNWEIAGNAICEKTGRGMVSIMRQFENPLIGEMILKNRRGVNHGVVPKDSGGLRSLMKALHQDKIVTILIDQHATDKESVATTFFGQPCNTHKTPALLHLKTGVPIFPGVTRRRNDNFEFDIIVGDPICYTATEDKEQDIKNIMQQCNDTLEKIIAEEPTQWLWIHRRWTNINR